ncbi:hypothetical protein ACKWTF_001521 [Chironomus riparius]
MNAYYCDLTIQNPNGLNNFTEIRGTHSPGRENEDVTSIIRTSSSISTNFPSIICNTFPNVQTLKAWSIGIERIDEDSFKNCRNLDFLDLSGNRIFEIHEKSFSENKRLNSLLLMENILTTLPETIFLNQFNLGILVISSNNFTDLPLKIFATLKNLVKLDIGDCQLHQLRVEWFRNLLNLQILQLPSNQFEDFPHNVFNPIRELLELDLDFNQLKVIHSDWFGILPNFRILHLRANQINAVDERFIDNNDIVSLGMLNNLCLNDIITDFTSSKLEMRAALQTCFKNFSI